MDKDKLITEALDNIREDRKKTEKLLTELQGEFATGEATHARAGVVAAKYLETLQRSNEQLVKIIAQINKKKDQDEDLTLSNEETENIFEMIKDTA